MPKNLWNEKETDGLSGLDLLVYRSRLLGADRSVCNIFGGNTGSKTIEKDFRGRDVRTLWVKGSGSDLATMQRKDFAGLRLDDIDPLFERGAMSDEDMVAYLTQCLIGLNMPRQSIETLLHAFIPAAHTDHTHPDAVISVACSVDGKKWMREIYGERAAWVDYIRPGFTLSKQIGEAVRANPNIECVVMGKHGCVTWDDDPRKCYDKTIRVIGEAEQFIDHRAKGRRVFGSHVGGVKGGGIAEQILPMIRGAVSLHGRNVVLFDESEDVMSFVNSEHAEQLAAKGAACPDHLVHTKRTPLFIDWNGDDINALKTKIREGVTDYIARYKEYFDQHTKSQTENPKTEIKMFNPAPRIILVRNVGMFTTGKDVTLADVSNQLYHRAISVMHGASALDEFVSLSPAEAFEIEYWPLELYKLAQRPPDRELAGRVALVTGAASGIGRATAYRLAQEGAHVVVADLNLNGAQTVAEDIVKRHGKMRALAVNCDVTSEENIIAAFKQTIATYGGVDIVVNNAGIASSSTILDTTAAEWDKLMNILARGYFLVSREAFRVWQEQSIGGSLIFVASKNGLIGSKNAAAYGAAKAAELNLARCLAEEGGALGIRVNTVNPDAVLQGSGIWDAGWREARAKSMGVSPDQLEDAYRQRNALKASIYPEDIAEAILFFASDRSSKTTGGIVNVDGGVTAAYVR
jgi:rhamnulose-1-phosphate aldolase/alcohol dehydrogenase